jgi:hypothetical protein
MRQLYPIFLCFQGNVLLAHSSSCRELVGLGEDHDFSSSETSQGHDSSSGTDTIRLAGPIRVAG